MNMEVKVFSTPTCPYCRQLKEFLNSNKVNFTDVDVSKDTKAREYVVEKTNQMGVPVLEADGKFVVGFDREKVAKLLKIKL